jgi:hypothetical protein
MLGQTSLPCEPRFKAKARYSDHSPQSDSRELTPRNKLIGQIPRNSEQASRLSHCQKK